MQRSSRNGIDAGKISNATRPFKCYTASRVTFEGVHRGVHLYQSMVDMPKSKPSFDTRICVIRWFIFCTDNARKSALLRTSCLSSRAVIDLARGRVFSENRAIGKNRGQLPNTSPYAVRLLAFFTAPCKLPKNGIFIRKHPHKKTARPKASHSFEFCLYFHTITETEDHPAIVVDRNNVNCHRPKLLIKFC